MTDSLPFLLSSVLCCFAFSLSQDWELPMKREVGGWGWSLAQQPASLLEGCGGWWLRQGPLAVCSLSSGRCPCVQEEKQPLKEGVQDMLVKHHLFSWDIDG